MLSDWHGDIVFTDRIAIFRGEVGPNKRHSHWAAQLTVALDGEVGYETDRESGTAPAVYISANTPHQLQTGVYICSVYFDPLVIPSLQGLDLPNRAGCTPLRREDLPASLRSLTKSSPLDTLLSHPPFNALARLDETEPRVAAVLKAIEQAIRAGEDMDRQALAARLNLSPSRFSHWFVETVGVPLRSYKKWLKLRLAMDALLAGRSPMEAAMAAGFSDLPHLSRAFSESLGLTYMDALRAWQRIQQARQSD